MTQYYYIDLFAGCGGLSLGLYNSGVWKGVFAIEKSPDAFQTLKHNLIDNSNHFDWPAWLPQQNHDINEFITRYQKQLGELKSKVMLVAGGPPCQGFSFAGRRNEKDERNKLIDSYIEFIRLTKPKALFFENVRGFTIGFKRNKKRGKPYSEYVWKKLEDLGYDIYGEVIDFADYGLPQKRRRFILVGFLEKDAKVFFTRLRKNRNEFLKSKGLKREKYTLQDAISDLLRSNGVVNSPDSNNFKAGIYSSPKSDYQEFLRNGAKLTGKVIDSHRFANHNKKTESKFKEIIAKGIRNKNVYGNNNAYNTSKAYAVLLDSNFPCPTLTTLPDDYIHYSEPRILTVREYARLQSFPDWYEIKGKYTTGGKARIKEVPRYTQIGNAIPPIFAELCGHTIKEVV